jgi:uncharacterized protein (TIGR02680 family)
MPTVPPAPPTERFQPVRAGLLNLYEYGNQVFEFADGHLLLRGPNGSGKSKALELLLPFALDGDTTPHKLDNFASSSRPMKWNLLMGGRHRNRVGYAWLEFGRTTPAGTPEWVTTIVGLKAVADNPRVQTWFIVLRDRRVGADFRLLNDNDEPFSRAGLEQRLECEVMDTASEFRVRVNEALFGYQSMERHATMLELSRQLRRSKLSESLDPEELSDILSNALPYIDQELVSEIGAHLDTIEQLRRDLAAMVDVRDRFQAFCDTYRDYARAVVLTRGQHTATAGRELRTAQGELTALAKRLDGTRETLRALEERIRELSGELLGARGAKDELMGSEPMKAVEAVRRLRQTVGIARRASEQAAEALGDINTRVEAAQQDLEHSQTRVRDTGATVTLIGERALVLAERVGVVGHEELATGKDPTADAHAMLSAAKARAAHVERQWELRRKVESARQRAELLGDDADRSERAASEMRGRLEECEQQLTAAREKLAEDVRNWATALSVFRVDESLTEALQDACAIAGEESAPRLRDLLEPELTRHRDELANARARLGSKRERLAERRAPLERELAALRAKRDREPEPPGWRTASRDRREGAPLWRLVDFAEGLTDVQRAGLEAALQASGLLDAWLLPSGQLLGIAGDVGLVDVGGDGSLESMLRAEPGAVVPTEMVRKVLGGVHVVEAGADSQPGPCVIGLDGSFRLGPAAGRHVKATAELIGASARAAARARRMDEVLAELAGLDAEAAALEARDAGLAARADAGERELGMLPSDAQARADARNADTLQRQFTTAQAHAVERRAEAHTAEAAAQQARKAAVAHAAEHRLPAPGQLGPSLQDIADALRDYEQRVRELLAARRTHEDQLLDVQRLTDALSGLSQRERALGVEASRTEAQLAEQEGALRAMEGALDVDPEALLAQLEALKASISQVEAEQAAASESRDQLVHAEAEQAAKLTGARERIVALEDGVTEALRRFRALAGQDFFGLALAAGAPSAEQVLSMDAGAVGILVRDHAQALRTRAHLETLTDTVDRAFVDLRLRLDGAAMAQPYKDTADGLVVVGVERGGQRQPVRVAVNALDQEIELHNQHLTDEEQRVLEDFLFKGLAQQLRLRIRAAKEMVDRTNTALCGRQTSSGIEVKLDWVPRDAGSDPLLDRALKLLTKDVQLLTDAERTELTAFFRDRVQQARDIADEGTTAQHLLAALDYRTWHVFKVLQRLDGIETILTKSLHQSGSGGEKAAALLLPLLAAAAAHFSAARPTAPRLIMLDEAFAGIDSTMQRHLLTLIESFDLDFMFTSHELWCCERELGALSIYTLHRVRGLGSVASWRFLWDGSTKSDMEPDTLAA